MRTIAQYLANLRQLLLAHHPILRVRVVYAEQQVARVLQLDAQRHIHATGIQDSELARHPQIPALRQERHTFASLQAQRHETSAQTVRHLACLAERGLGPYVIDFLTQENVLAELLCVMLDKVDNSRFCFHYNVKYLNFNLRITHWLLTIYSITQIRPPSFTNIDG